MNNTKHDHDHSTADTHEAKFAHFLPAPKKAPPTRNRMNIGIGVSLVWILVVLALVLLKQSSIQEMDLNEWGDFFAGVFAPLAFLWLVLGYLQQGDELRLSTDALRLQAQELNHSVTQQRELVQVTRQQLDAERLAYRETFERQRLAVQPRFKVMPSNIENQKQRFDLMNTGASVTDVTVTLFNRTVDGLLLSHGNSMASGETHTHLIILDLIESELARIDIRFRDNLGFDGSVSIKGKYINPSEGYVWTQENPQ
ncbi:hypothetical protein [Hydrogenophaga sp. SL48]|uniref:hypothetical protein n=1 Tax=Hydrogenophaga sp. SL48 TaxID=2806347 RepID=UPI001F39A484|nr:hypothetical protein [Hydrogenophaga sp. SL48]UJW81520.1 hypothetical protein IM738_01945 [Hydrogenophaga sp. SL48]